MRFSRSDLTVSLAILLAAAGLLYLFVDDLNAFSSRAGERSLGTVVFRKLSATRKASSALSWERMHNDSPVYDADTLRTADRSEATIHFEDGTSLDMSEDSMIKLDFGGKNRNLEFLEGQISLGSGNGPGYTVSSSAGAIDLGRGAAASFSREADTLKLELSQGSASFVKRDGSIQAVAQNQELQVELKSGAAVIVARPILAVSPGPNSRLLSYTGPGAGPEARAGVDFAWQVEAPATGKAPYSLELSRSKDFEPSETTHATDTSTRVELAPGSWYWRVRDSTGNESPPRRFLLELAESPHPSSPPDGQQYAYRRLKPEIRFAWTGLDLASAYLLEIASEPSFAKPVIRSRTTTTSLAVDSLGEGSWYWRVSPIHAFTVIGDAGSGKPAPRSLVIARSQTMAALSPTAPLDASLYQIQDLSGLGLDFSWLPNAEAVSYQLILSKAKDLSSPIATIDTARPYRNLSGQEAAPLGRSGAYYWGLRWFDREGNASPLSSSRSLKGIDGSVALRLSFPPEGYRIADSLVSDTRFAWKSKLPARTAFQLARDPLFTDLAYQETVSAETLLGRSWPSGEYHWRLCAYNADGSSFSQTEGRRLVIVPPFEAPILASPEAGKILYLREHDTARFAWGAISGADYYKASLRSAADSYRTAVLNSDFLEEAKFDYRLGDLPSGTYRLSLQAFANDGPTTTRIIGYKADVDIVYRRIAYLALALPAKDAHLSGLDARRGELVFSYIGEDEPETAEVLVSADAQARQVIAKRTAEGGRARIGRLEPGLYYWTARGLLAGLDISARESFRFFVDPIPPLPAPELLGPAEGEVFDVAKLSSRRSITLAWKAVAGANRYILRLEPSGGGKPIIARDDLVTPGFVISDLSILDKGRFTWSVEARLLDAGGELEQAGTAASSFFIIALPVLPKAAPANNGNFYGL